MVGCVAIAPIDEKKQLATCVQIEKFENKACRDDR